LATVALIPLTLVCRLVDAHVRGDYARWSFGFAARFTSVVIALLLTVLFHRMRSGSAW